MMFNGYRNAEGYPDPTAGEAMRRVDSTVYGERRRFMPLVYICSRYAGDEEHSVEDNVADAVRYSKFAIEKGCIPLPPHLLYPQVLDDNNPEERRIALFFGSVWLDIAKEIWIFSNGGYDTYSNGMRKEFDRARKKGYRIRYFTEDLMEV